MHQEAIDKLYERGKAIAYFLSLEPEEQEQVWPLLSRGVIVTLKLLDAIAEEPRTYEELAAIVGNHPTTISQKLNVLAEFIHIEFGENTAYTPSEYGGRPRRLAKRSD